MDKRCRTNATEVAEESDEAALFQCAELILPWLRPSELVSMSSTCKTLHRMAKSVTIRRAADAARSFENLPVPFINTVDHRPYAYFIYTPSQTIASSTPSLKFQRQAWGFDTRIRPASESVGVRALVSETGENAYGCTCEVCDEEPGCPCSSSLSSEMVAECGPGCRCGLECGNRLTQRGVSVRLKIVRDLSKGWGLHADQLILRGQFICEYAGELLITKEARRRQQMYDELAVSGQCSSALLVVKEHLPSGKACMRVNIDATRIGNVARFINHSCDGGNLSTRLVRSFGVLLPRLCFYAVRDIEKHEELTFSYGIMRLRPKGLQCLCNSSSCFGLLPSEHT